MKTAIHGPLTPLLPTPVSTIVWRVLEAIRSSPPSSRPPVNGWSTVTGYAASPASRHRLRDESDRQAAELRPPAVSEVAWLLELDGVDDLLGQSVRRRIHRPVVMSLA